jgi:hypothetical protein
MGTRNSLNDIWYGHTNRFPETQATVLPYSAECGLYDLLCPDLDILTTCRLFICMTLLVI